MTEPIGAGVSLRHRRSRSARLLIALWLSISCCMAHPDLIEEITAITKQLGEQGASSTRYLQRADLFRRHGQFDEALADIESAERLQTNTSRLALERARVLCDAGRVAESFENIEVFLKNEPTHGEALIIRARCQAKLGRPGFAIADYDSAIARCFAPSPDLFLERAKLQAALGKLDEAVRGLDTAITNTATFSILQLAAIDYDRQRGAFDSALVRVDGFVAKYPVKEPWLTLRAEVLEQAGRTMEAAQTFQQVLSGIETYPTIRRSLDLTKQLENRASQGLVRTQAKPKTNLPVES